MTQAPARVRGGPECVIASSPCVCRPRATRQATARGGGARVTYVTLLTSMVR